jgi:hypothetical protein
LDPRWRKLLNKEIYDFSLSPYITRIRDRLCGLVATDPKVPGSIPGATKFSEDK